jgi:hypothetical protein
MADCSELQKERFRVRALDDLYDQGEPRQEYRIGGLASESTSRLAMDRQNFQSPPATESPKQEQRCSWTGQNGFEKADFRKAKG